VSTDQLQRLSGGVLAEPSLTVRPSSTMAQSRKRACAVAASFVWRRNKAISAGLLEFGAIAAASVSELLRSLYEPSFAALPFFVRC
jgi:hypothetical protein